MSDDRIEEGGTKKRKRPPTPSLFMREMRPELYSDTVDRPLYVLDRAMLEFQLETMTARNEHQRFEIFCRKLCERVICPHIRPQSGPEGGGDGKTDADTFPVAEAIADLGYVGTPGPDRDDWGFAFSAMKDWKRKVVKDVAGIAGTGRKLERVYFVTSQPARAADRARIEAELEAAHGMPVKILDRAWIVEEVIDRERKDIAHDYLGVGQVVSDPMRMGPEDYSRRRRLEDVERALADPSWFECMERQLVTEAMVAAQLSRNLELPRHETDGRHARAIRLAVKHGSARQQLEARHDALWTAFWWFDDAAAVSDGYAGIEAEALGADHARNIEFLVQLHQLLVNAVLYRMLSPDDADLSPRSDRLEAALEAMTRDEGRPNHRLEARTSLAVVRLGRYFAEGRTGELPAIWAELGSILDEAAGLAEFDADRLVRLIDVVSIPAGRDPTYRAVAERLADFVAIVIDPAREHIIVHRAAPAFEPRQQARPSIWQQFELNGTSCFLLHDDCPRSDLAAADKIADLHLNEVAAPKLAVDREIEQRPISQAAALIEVETDFPNLLRFQSPLCTHSPSGIPDRALGGGEFCFRHLHDRSPMATLAICRTLADEDAQDLLWGSCRPIQVIQNDFGEGQFLTKAADHHADSFGRQVWGSE